MSAPLIGITGRRMPAGPDWVAAARGEPLDAHFAAYAGAIARAGGLPVQLPREAAAAELASRLDGVLLAGGEDVSADLYDAAPASGAEHLAGVTAGDRRRDEHEMELLGAARAAGLPVLGICRGVQLINVALGGTLIGHLDGPLAATHTAWDRPHDEHRHAVSTAPGSVIRSLIGETALVNSLHHQAVGRPGDGLVVTARAPDQVPEALESQDGAVLAVQWHPEFQHDQDAVFGWLVRHAASCRN